MSNDKASLIKSLTGLVHALHLLPEKNPLLITEIVKKSGLVNEQWYNGSYPDVACSRYTAVQHYSLYGYNEGRVPSPIFADLAPAIARQPNPNTTNLEKYLERVLAHLFLAEDGEDADDIQITRQGSYATLYDLPLYVHWSITKMCNYNCSYCSYRHGEDKRIDKKRFVPFQKLINAVENLAALNRPFYEFVLLGGEPTAHPRLPELLQHTEARLKGRLQKVTIVSNGSREPAWFNLLAEQAQRLPLLIAISIHLEQANAEHIIKLVRELHPALRLNFILMMHPEKLDKAQDIHSKLCQLRTERPFDAFLQPIYAPPAFTDIDPRYTNDFFNLRNELEEKFAYAANASGLPNEKISSPFLTFWEVNEKGRTRIIPGGDRSIMHQRGLLNFSGMHCVCGTNLARIDEDGKLQGGVCNFANTDIDLYQPNAINDGNFMQIVKCPAEFCACNDNDINMKFRDREEAEQYLEFAKLKQQRLMQLSRNSALPL